MEPEQRWQLRTGAGCELIIGRYPSFRYDATGGGGLSRPQIRGQENLQPLVFAAEGLVIPPLDASRGRFLGLPLPPGVSIQIQPDELAGELNISSGELRLHFRSRFRFTVGSPKRPLYQASDLLVDTQLTSGSVQSKRHSRSGRPLASDGSATLVGVATIEPCQDPWLNQFLGLPDEALALMHLTLERV
ncbi:hypothetical protein [Vulcanococcus sp.]|uniref:hypothetical protein n=1 Tax=Vulcanococcus sp. TaxID=2856995 RepID=UPI003C024614